MIDDRSLRRLTHLNLAEACRERARWSGVQGRIEERDGLMLFATASPFPASFNGVLAMDPALDAATHLDTAGAWFGELGRGYNVWADDDGQQSGDLAARCRERGLYEIGSMPVMVVRAPLAESPLPEGLELVWVDDERTMGHFIAVNDLGFASLGLPTGTMLEAITDLRALTEPQNQSVVAYFDGEPVGAAMTLLGHGGAGVYFVATVEEARGRGVGEAVTRAVTNRAFDLGARWNCLQASVMGEPVYRRLGYETIYRYDSFLRFV